MFEIGFDERERVLTLRLEGFWTLATLASFTAQLLATVVAVRVRGRGRGGFAVLSDARGFPVQSGPVAAGFTAIMQKGARYNDGPTAIVVASALNRAQVERTMAGPRLRVFLDIDEAREWLRTFFRDAIAA